MSEEIKKQSYAESLKECDKKESNIYYQEERGDKTRNEHDVFSNRYQTRQLKVKKVRYV